MPCRWHHRADRAGHHAGLKLRTGGQILRHVRHNRSGWLGHMFDGTEDDPEIRRMVATVVAAEQVRLLQANGVDEFHFYTLNRPDLTYAIAHVLGVRPQHQPDPNAPML